MELVGQNKLLLQWPPPASPFALAAFEAVRPRRRRRRIHWAEIRGQATTCCPSHGRESNGGRRARTFGPNAQKWSGFNRLRGDTERRLTITDRRLLVGAVHSAGSGWSGRGWLVAALRAFSSTDRSVAPTRNVGQAGQQPEAKWSASTKWRQSFTGKSLCLTATNNKQKQENSSALVLLTCSRLGHTDVALVPWKRPEEPRRHLGRPLALAVQERRPDRQTGLVAHSSSQLLFHFDLQVFRAQAKQFGRAQSGHLFGPRRGNFRPPQGEAHRSQFPSPPGVVVFASYHLRWTRRLQIELVAVDGFSASSSSSSFFSSTTRNVHLWPSIAATTMIKLPIVVIIYYHYCCCWFAKMVTEAECSCNESPQ